MKPFNRLVKQIRIWRFNRSKRRDIKTDTEAIKRLEQTLSKLPETPARKSYELKIKAFKDLSRDALESTDEIQYLNVRKLQADIIIAFVNDIQSNQLDKTRDRPGVA